MRYAHGDEYRDADEIRKIAEALPGTPVTNGHPNGLIKAGIQARIVGRVDSAWVDGEHVAVRITVSDAAAARGIKAGARELSLGYTTSLDDNNYQRGTEVDHLAIVQSARCGATCSLRTDEVRLDCGCGAQIDPPTQTTESARMEAKTDAQRADELETTVATLNARIATLEADILSGAQAAESDAVKTAVARADAADAQIAKFAETLQTEARARAKLERDAGKVMGPTFRMDDMTERQIQDSVVKRLEPSIDVSSENADQIRGRYNTLVAIASRSIDSNAESKQRLSAIVASANDAPRKDTAATFEDLERNRWKQTLKNGRGNAVEGR